MLNYLRDGENMLFSLKYLLVIFMWIIAILLSFFPIMIYIITGEGLNLLQLIVWLFVAMLWTINTGLVTDIYVNSGE